MCTQKRKKKGQRGGVEDAKCILGDGDRQRERASEMEKHRQTTARARKKGERLRWDVMNIKNTQTRTHTEGGRNMETHT